MGAAILPDLIEGPDLVLRRWTTEDVERLAALVAGNVDHLRPWMAWIADEPLSHHERFELIERWERQWRQGGDVVMAIEWHGVPVGGTGLHRRRGPQGLEIGYWVDKDHLRRGIATQAAALLTTAALATDGIEFVEIHHDKANVPSAAVARRLGYRFLGEWPDPVTAPGETGIDCAWRMVAEQWQPQAILDWRR